MIKYTVIFSVEAKMDMALLEDYIRDDLKSPLTASNYMKELDDTIQELSMYAGSVAISTNDYIQLLYGPEARRINYKKMAIIFTVYKNYAYIKRVIPASLIL